MTTVQRKLLHLFLLGFAAALAAWLLVHLLGQREQRKVEKRAAERVLPAGLEVTGITWTTPESTFELERAGEDWQLLAPVKTTAEDATVEGLLHHLVSLERLREVGRKRPDGTIEPPKDLWLYGLEPARFTIGLRGADGIATVLRVGKKNHFDGSLYVKVEGAPEVMQVEGALEYQVDKSLYQLRDKRLLSFVAEDVTRLVVRRRGAEGFSLVREGDGFFLREPRRAADPAQVTGMLSALANVRAQEFLSERATAGERIRFGLDEPAVRVTVSLAGGADHELWLTRQAVGNDVAYYAMRAGDHPILLLGSAWVLEKVDVDSGTLRDRHLLRFSRDQVRQLTLVRGEERLVFERMRNEADTRDEWRILEPIEAAADDPTLAGVLYRLGSSKAKRIVHEEATEDELAAAGLSEPEVVVELSGDDGELGVLRFSVAQRGHRFATSGRRIDEVESSFVDELSWEVGDYREAVP